MNNLSSTLLQRQVNNVEYNKPRMSFEDLCLGVTQTRWGRTHELTTQDVRLHIKQNSITSVAIQPAPVHFDNLMDRLFTPKPRPLCICYGMGVDSTALLIHLARMYHSEPNKCPQYRPDFITFADTGGEKKETYAYEVVIQDYLKQMGFPPVTTVRYVPNESRVKHGMYYTLEQNCLMNATLPSLAFGYKKCSIKAKRIPQDKYRAEQEMVQKAWAAGLQAICAIGYDAGPKDQRRADVVDDEQYEYWYPLIQLGWDRERCIAEIKAEGLPGWSDWRGKKWVKSGGQPVKSACWFCPSNKPEELQNFAQTVHGRDYLRGIVRMEDTAQPHLTAIQGLWRNGVKGTRDASKKRPGRMADYIQQQGLLDPNLSALPVLGQGEHEFSGWRGLFDSGCYEWNEDSEMADKVRVIRLAREVLECSFGFLVFLYVKDCLSEGKYSQLHYLPRAVYDLSAHDVNIEDYLKRCNHSLFRRAPGKMHWKESVVRQLIDGDGRPLWAEDLDGLLLTQGGSNENHN